MEQFFIHDTLEMLKSQPSHLEENKIELCAEQTMHEFVSCHTSPPHGECCDICDTFEIQNIFSEKGGALWESACPLFEFEDQLRLKRCIILPPRRLHLLETALHQIGIQH